MAVEHTKERLKWEELWPAEAFSAPAKNSREMRRWPAENRRHRTSALLLRISR
jgi:hypothetical protein